MFKFLRSQAKVFYWVIAGSFVLFLVLGGLTGRGCQAPGTSKKYEPGVIGKVNGTKLMAQAYDQAVKQQTDMLHQQFPDRELTADQFAMARQRGWDELVQDALVEQAIKKDKIKVTDQEVLDTFKNNPPQELLANYRDKDGKVDMEKYYADLQNPNIDWSRAENYIRTFILPRQKLMTIITAGATVDDAAVKAEYLRQTGRAVAEFMGISFSDLEASAPSDSEITAYYNNHLDDFQGEAKVACSFVRFPKEPSAADYADVRSYIQDIRTEIISGKKSFADAAKEYSEDSTADNGGDLGTFDRKRMVEPFTKAAFSLPVGEVSEPVKTPFGYHLIEVLDQEKDPASGEVVKVHARHILLKVSPGPATLDEVHTRASDFLDAVTSADFVTQAKADSLDLHTVEPFSPSRDIPGLPLSLEGSQWLSASEPGNISTIFENKDCYYVILSGQKVPAGPEPLKTVRGRVIGAVKSEKLADLAREKLNPAVGEVQMGSTMAAVAAKFGLIHAVTDTFNVNTNIPQVGYGTDFNKLVLADTVGTLIPEIQTQRGMFAAIPLWIKPFDEKDFQQRKDGIMGYLLNQAQGKIGQKWLDDQKAAADIVDYRYARAGRR